MEIINSGKVACWYFDDEDMPIPLTPTIGTGGTFSIALINSAFSFGRNGRWRSGAFNRHEFISYLEGMDGSEKYPLEAWLMKAMEQSEPAQKRKSDFLEEAKAAFKGPTGGRLSDNEFNRNWKAVVSRSKFSEWARPGAPTTNKMN